MLACYQTTEVKLDIKTVVLSRFLPLNQSASLSNLSFFLPSIRRSRSINGTLVFELSTQLLVLLPLHLRSSSFLL
jgi:hypothetical protein